MAVPPSKWNNHTLKLYNIDIKEVQDPVGFFGQALPLANDPPPEGFGHFWTHVTQEGAEDAHADDRTLNLFVSRGERPRLMTSSWSF